MNNSNIIISVIIVLCIAAGVTAYSLTNNDSNNVFTDLQGFTPDTEDSDDLGDDGINENTTNSNTGNGVVPTENSGNGASYGSGNGDSNDNTNSNGNSNNNKNSANSNHNKNIYISKSAAKSIAASHIEESGCYVGTPSLSGGVYYCPVFDKNGNKVDSIAVNAKTGTVIGRG